MPVKLKNQGKKIPGIPTSSSTITKGTAKVTKTKEVERKEKEKGMALPNVKEQKEYTRELKEESGPNSLEGFSVRFIIPAVLAIILLLIIFAIFSDFNSKSSIELEAYRIITGGGRIEEDEWFSAEVINVNSKNAKKWGISSKKQGVIVTEVEGIQDVKLKLHEGDVIHGINGGKIKNFRDFRKASKMFDQKAGLFLDINRYGSPMYVSIPNPGFQNGGASAKPPPSITTDAIMPHEYRGVCIKCHQIIDIPR